MIKPKIYNNNIKMNNKLNSYNINEYKFKTFLLKFILH